MTKAIVLAGLTVLLLVVGCKTEVEGPRTVPASGVLILDGMPVEGAAIVFIGDDGVYSASGLSDSAGKFSLNAFEYKSGAVPGNYKAVVTKTVEVDAAPAEKGLSAEESEHAGEAAGQTVENSLPKKYETPGALSFEIPEEGVTDLTIALTSD